MTAEVEGFMMGEVVRRSFNLQESQGKEKVSRIYPGGQSRCTTQWMGASIQTSRQAILQDFIFQTTEIPPHRYGFEKTDRRRGEGYSYHLVTSPQRHNASSYEYAVDSSTATHLALYGE